MTGETMNETERAALVEELAEAIHVDAARRRVFTAETAAESCLPIIERHLAAAAAPGMDELLDSVHPQAAITRMERSSRHKWYITIQWVTVPDTSPVLHTFIGTGPTRMDAIRNAVAQATGT